MSTGLEAALEYSRRGWHVFPLVACTKRPATAHGVHDAAADEATIVRWWNRSPWSGVGIATGRASGLVVLDVDPRSGGDDSLGDLEAAIGQLPETPVSLTGGGGTHYLFRHPEQHVPNRTALGGFQGIDLKGEGGYIVSPPSLHPNGREYAWNVMLHPAEVALAPCPSGLLLLAEARGVTPRLRYEHRDWDGSIPARVRILLRSDRRFRERFRRSTDRLRDTSPSGVDFALAMFLALKGLDGAEIESAIKASRAQAHLPPRRPSYFDSTIGKALGVARGA